MAGLSGLSGLSSLFGLSGFTPDTTPPVISSIAVGASSPSNATISWATNEPADSLIEYGPTAGYGYTTTLDPTLTLLHAQTLTLPSASGFDVATFDAGLFDASGGGTYHYRVKSRDAAGNLTTSADQTFTAGAVSVSAYTIAADAVGTLTHHWRLAEASGAVASPRIGAVAGTYARVDGGGYTLGMRGLVVKDGSSGVHFNGTDGKVTFGNVLGETGTGAFGYAVVYRPNVDQPAAILTLFAKTKVVAAQREGISCTIESGRVRLQRWQAGASDSCWGATVLAGRVTYHIAATYDGTTMTVYVNGVLDASLASAKSVQAHTGAFSVGYDDGIAANPLVGTIQDVMRFSAALSPANVTALYDAMSLAAGTTTYYVSTSGNDANAGSFPFPWRTLYRAGAADALNAGDTLVMEDGVYAETQVRSGGLLANGGVVRSPITIRPRNDWRAGGAQIQFTGLRNTEHGFSLLSTPYVTVQDFLVSQDVAGTTAADVCLRAGSVPHGPANSSGDYRAYDAADFCSFRNLRVIGHFTPVVIDHAHGCTVQLDQIEGADVHVDCVNASSPLIDTCTFLANAVAAQTAIVRMRGGTRSPVVSNNLIRSTAGAGALAAGIVLGGQSTTAYDASASGYEAYKPSAYNNVVVSDTPGAIVTAIALQGANGPLVSNNVVIGCQAMVKIQTGGLMLVGGTTRPKTNNPVVENNVGDACTDDVLYAVNAATDRSGSLTYDYNLLHGVTNHNVAQVHTSTTDPLFVDRAADWHVYSTSPTVGAGTAVAQTGYYGETIPVTLDRDGATRSAWNSGLYEATVPAPVVLDWTTQYWNNATLTGSPVLTRVETVLGAVWGAASPVPGTVNADNFSLRATKTFNVPVMADYQFALRSDDGARLYVNGVIQINSWVPRNATTDTTIVTLPSGANTIVVEYFEQTGGAELSISWALYVAPSPITTPVNNWQTIINATPSGSFSSPNYAQLPEGVYRPNGGANPFPVVLSQPYVELQGLVVGGSRRSSIRGMDIWAGWSHTGPSSTWVSDSTNTYSGVVPVFDGLTSDNIYSAPASRIPCLVKVDDVEQLMVPYSGSSGPGTGQAMIDPGRRIILGTNPAGKMVEVAVVKNLVLVQASDVGVNDLLACGGVPFYQQGLLRKRGVGVNRTSWRRNDVSSSYHNLIESFYGDGDAFLSNLLHDAGANAVEAGGQWGTRTTVGMTFNGDQIDRCNQRGYSTSWDVGAVKLVWVRDVFATGVVIQDSPCTGFWVDTNCWNINWINSIIRRCNGGFMYEVSSGPADASGCTAEDITGDGFLAWTACGFNVHGCTARRCGTGIRFQWQAARVGEFTGSSCNNSGNVQSGNTFVSNGANTFP